MDIRTGINYIRKHKAFSTFVVVILLVLYGLIFSDYGFIQRKHIGERLDSINAEIREQKDIEKELRSNIIRLQKDTIEIERLAREKYKMVRPGERVFLIKKQDSSSTEDKDN